ncbi:endonuclease/exonuclease/phosphatase family protein [Odoribacter lunatus]|uniref:endonuclease/exonuclease/phosphatase family protein n=1 Tax=Odoribacter lunatus TaxID=2941335 RepID=UPI0020423C23|nr:endonuclease/exonuclease/phosphatase family protein [Odoribacter lunatus]
MGRLLDKIIFLISIPFWIGLLGAYTARYINPNLFIIPSLLGLAYPYLLVANILLLLYWIARLKKMVIVSLIVLCSGIPFFTSYYGTNSSDTEEHSYDISVLSYNVRFFDKYKWSQDKRTYNKLIDYLNQFKGDLICLQEFPITNQDANTQHIIKQLSTYPFHCHYRDMAIFSRLPILHSGQIPADNTKNCVPALFCNIQKGKDTLRIYNVHLESYKLGQEERKFVKNITSSNTEKLSDGIKNILSHIIKANKFRAKQAILIQKHIQQSPYKIILCGDFNDTPLSYIYKTINTGLTDSFLQKGKGLGNTYIGEFPSFRIDYILHSSDFITLSYTRQSVNLSDHYPISCKLKIRP